MFLIVFMVFNRDCLIKIYDYKKLFFILVNFKILILKYMYLLINNKYILYYYVFLVVMMVFCDVLEIYVWSLNKFDIVVK